MADENEPLPWDYFLTAYERDLILLDIEDIMQKYPWLSQEQIQRDFLQVIENTGISMDKLNQLREDYSSQ